MRDHDDSEIDDAFVEDVGAVLVFDVLAFISPTSIVRRPPHARR